MVGKGWGVGVWGGAEGIDRRGAAWHATASPAPASRKIRFSRDAIMLMTI